MKTAKKTTQLASVDPTQQVWQFDNKPAIQDNDLFLISDESTVNHVLKNVSAYQASGYLFPSLTGAYAPLFSNFVNGVSGVTNIMTAYMAANTKVNNWVQVTCKATLTFGPVSRETFDMTIPFGGNFLDVNDAIFMGGIIDNPSTTQINPYGLIRAVVNTNRVTVFFAVNAALANTSPTVGFSFVYKIR